MREFFMVYQIDLREKEIDIVEDIFVLISELDAILPVASSNHFLFFCSPLKENINQSVPRPF
jgi:hypothetical protein